MKSNNDKFTKQNETNRSLKNIVELVKSEAPVCFRGKWNEDKYLLGCENGVIDLKTGKQVKGKRSDYISQSTMVEFDPKAKCPLFIQTLNDIFEGDRRRIAYLRRVVGYMLTGDTSEQVIFIFIGNGANGKSVLISALHNTFGNYSYNAPSSIFEKQRNNSVPNDVASIKDNRLVTVSEWDASAQLNESVVKALTGDDLINARFLYGEFFEFKPKAKYILANNHLPHIRDTSNGIWRRLKMLPFNRTFSSEEMDKHLTQKFKAEASGILNWAIKGCLEWQKRGLDTPKELEQLVSDYREQEDPIDEFIKDDCILGDREKVGRELLFNAYVRWANKKTMKYPVGKNKFYNTIGIHFKPIKIKGDGYYKGISLKSHRLSGGGVGYAIKVKK